MARKIWRIFSLGGLIKVGIFFGYSKQSEDSCFPGGSSPNKQQPNLFSFLEIFKARKFAIYFYVFIYLFTFFGGGGGGGIFGPVTFLGFVAGARGTFLGF